MVSMVVDSRSRPGHVVRVDAFVGVVHVAAVRRIGEEVAGARRDIDPAVAHGDPERMTRCGALAKTETSPNDGEGGFLRPRTRLPGRR